MTCPCGCDMSPDSSVIAANSRHEARVRRAVGRGDVRRGVAIILLRLRLRERLGLAFIQLTELERRLLAYFWIAIKADGRPDIPAGYRLYG